MTETTGSERTRPNFSRTHAAARIPFHAEIPVAFERFTVPYEE